MPVLTDGTDVGQDRMQFVLLVIVSSFIGPGKCQASDIHRHLA